ncbi:conserved membrane hypothetical protein [Tenacibaculum litopenaei]|uniref:DoxX family protein n=1 Tax=Tenacibaculum litopenaei TaxID=396016 RepID=UPI0038942B10
MNDSRNKWAYLLLRVAVGIGLTLRGGVRLSKLAKFRDWMLGMFEETMLPNWLVFSWGTLLPILEFGIGLLIVIGLYTQRALIWGGSMLIVLMIGACFAEQWSWIQGQMLYLFAICGLLFCGEKNDFSIDFLIKNFSDERIENL